MKALNVSVHVLFIGLVVQAGFLFMAYGKEVTELPVAQEVKYDTTVRRMVFAECLTRIKTVKANDEWSVAVKDCGDLARWESSF